MVPVNNNYKSCTHRNGNKCTNDKIASGPIVNDSLQSKWYCSTCKYFEILN